MARLVLSRRPRRLRRLRKRNPRNRRGMRKMRIGRSMNAMKDHATVVEAQELTVVPNGGNFIAHHLGQFPRASAVSQNFRFYRCKKVEVEFIPYANVFQPGTSFPELYFQVDRTQGVTPPGVPLPLPDKAIMLSRGVLPLKWTNMIKRSWVPSVARNENLVYNTLGNNVQDLGSVTITPVKYKWYATQAYYPNVGGGNAAHFGYGTWGPQALQYYGAAYFIDCPVAPQSVLGTLKIKVHWEFKEPLVATEPRPPQSTQQILDANGSTTTTTTVQ